MPSKPYPSTCEFLCRRHAAVRAIHGVLAYEIYASPHRIQVGPFARKIESYAVAVDLSGKGNEVSRRIPWIVLDLGTGVPFLVERSIIAARARKGAGMPNAVSRVQKGRSSLLRYAGDARSL